MQENAHEIIDQLPEVTEQILQAADAVLAIYENEPTPVEAAANFQS